MIALAVQHLPQTLGTVKNAAKQVAFASAQALNDTAKDVQGFTVNSLLPSRFTLRAKGAPWFKPGTALGFNIRFANKTNLRAVLGSRADWLKLQEEGGTKTGTRSKTVAIPTKFWKAKEEIMAKHKKPRALLADINKAQAEVSAIQARISQPLDRSLTGRLRRSADKKALAAAKRGLRTAQRAARFGQFAGRPFIQTVQGVKGIWVRTTTKSLPIRPLFYFVDSARIQAAMQFVAQGRSVANKVYAKYFGKRIAHALATAHTT